MIWLVLYFLVGLGIAASIIYWDETKVSANTDDIGLFLFMVGLWPVFLVLFSTAALLDYLIAMKKKKLAEKKKREKKLNDE